MRILRGPKTLLDCLLSACETDPQRVVYTVLGDGENESDRCSYADLVARVTTIAAGLRERRRSDEAVLLLIRDPLRFIEAFLGCLWARVIPVPAVIPRHGQTNGFLSAICENARISAVITDVGDLDRLRSLLGRRIADDAWFTVDQIASIASYTGGPEASAGDTAFLQYTSGSTGHPKGVVVTHANLMGNQKALRCALQTNRESVFLSWLPLYHDMGLIGHALPPIYLTARCIIMPPASFLQQPIRWLRAISKYRATNSGGPNFSYELCIQKAPSEFRVDFDLSSWEAAYNGGEPVRADTIERFCATYQVNGFRRNALYPCYGLAESTLVVTGNRRGAGPQFLRVNKKQLEKGLAVPAAPESDQNIQLVSSGAPAGDARVIIVDALTCTTVDDGCVGEIWTSSESVCAGYFRDEHESRTQFAAHLAGTLHPSFLRTGDLGFIKYGQLYVTGRLKDVIIIHGHNHYPHDLEATASRCNSLLAPGLAAALTLDNPDGRSKLHIICELTRQGWIRAEPSTVAADVRQAIAAEHGLTVSRVILIRPGSLPRTSSGKVRRSACREMIRDGQLETLEDVPTTRRGKPDIGITALSSTDIRS